MLKLRWRLAALLIAAGLPALLIPATTAACPFCQDQLGVTLVEDFAQASMVLYGHFANARAGAGGGIDTGSSDFVIEKVLKSHEILKGKNVVALPKFIASNSKWIVFCDVYKTNINPYRGEEIFPDSELLAYMTNALQHKDEPLDKRLRYCFNFLNSPDLAVSTDAYRLFGKTNYADYKEMAKSLPAKKIAEWLQDPKTPSYRYGLLASLLGHCGDPKIHGPLLRSMLDDPHKQLGTSVDGIMAGYVMLQPEEAWKYLQKLFKTESEEFAVRYAGMRTLRFFWDNRNDVLTKDQMVNGMGMLIDQKELADFAIDDLRNWQAWSMTDRVLNLVSNKDVHPLVKRAVLRFALCSPSPRAKAFVDEQRQRDPSWVSDTEELLRADAPAVKKG